MNKTRTLIAIPTLALLMASLPAWATTAVPLPEPDALSLLAIGGVAALVVTLRNRRKNKK